MNNLDWSVQELVVNWEVFKNLQPLAEGFSKQNPDKSFGWVQEKLGPHSLNGIKLVIKRL